MRDAATCVKSRDVVTLSIAYNYLTYGAGHQVTATFVQLKRLT
jgi:hypothetical protein